MKITLLIAGFAALAAGLPKNPMTAGKSFSIQQVPRVVPVIRSPAARYAKALRKFHLQVPAHLAKAATRRFPLEGGENGTAPATPAAYDVEYLTPVTLGNQTLNLDFDTGSADLWVFSTELPEATRAGHEVYSPGSSSKKLTNYTWKIRYGDGSGASGDVYLDRVNIGGVTATSQAVEAAQSVSAQFAQDRNNDGLVGLSFSGINQVRPKPQLTFFDTVKSQLAQPLFAAVLKHNATGSYDFGSIDPTKFKGNLTYVPVDSSRGFWAFSADGYAVGNSDVTNSAVTGIADTGTTLILVNDDIVEAYYNQLAGSFYDYFNGGYVFPCSTTAPTFTLAVGGYKAVVPAEYLNYQPVSPGNPFCYGGVQSNSGLGFSIFGDVFLKSQYVVFDSQGPRLGFAPQA